MKLPKIRVATYRLTPYTEEHDALTVVWLNRPDIVETFGLSRSVTRESHRRWVESAKGVLIWAVVDGKSDHCANVLLHLNENNRSGYFQIYVGDPVRRGLGLGTAALRATLKIGFTELGLHRIWLHTIQGNDAAVRIYRKAGFVFEGKERDAIFRDGKFFYQCRWSMLAREWLSQNEAQVQ